MSRDAKKSFSEKHGADQKPEDFIKQEILNRIKDNTIACAVAFDIANALDVTPGRVGRTVDLMNIRLIKCQLGMFGYSSQNKIAKPADHVDTGLAEALRSGLVEGRLPCQKAWEIAARFKIPKLAVGSACEALGIKIKPCQLGAF